MTLRAARKIRNDKYENIEREREREREKEFRLSRDAYSQSRCLRIENQLTSTNCETACMYLVDDKKERERERKRGKKRWKKST